METNYDILLARYFGGNASEKDISAIEQWILTSPEHQAEFDAMTKLYAQLGGIALTDMPKPNAKRNKAAFMAHINTATTNNTKSIQPISKSIPFKRWMAVAASIIVIAVLSTMVWKTPMTANNDDIIVATQMNIKQAILPDSTKIDLSENSKIVYSANFAKGKKTLTLEGEASFDVGHKGEGQLQVNAGETIIEDIGTVFQVKAYTDSNTIQVTVSQGQVHFYTKTNEGLVINANETGVYNKSTKQFKLLVPTAEVLAQTGLHVHFQSMKIKEVVDIISKAYKVNIRFAQASIGDRQITVKFDGENLELVLQVIAETLEVNLEKDDIGYVFKQKE
jgi:ferric-dicitrate binding protein FerR (iron transport regulator)